MVEHVLNAIIINSYQINHYQQMFLNCLGLKPEVIWFHGTTIDFHQLK